MTEGKFDTSKILELFNSEIKVINLGIPSFAEDLERQNIKVIKVNWRPTALGNEKVVNLLNRIRAKQK